MNIWGHILIINYQLLIYMWTIRTLNIYDVALFFLMKSKHGCKDRYWKGVGKRQNFTAVGKTTAGKKYYPLVRLGWLGVRRHIKIKADANPYLPEYANYFWRRRNRKDTKFFPAFSARAYRAQCSA